MTQLHRHARPDSSPAMIKDVTITLFQILLIGHPTIDGLQIPMY